MLIKVAPQEILTLVLMKYIRIRVFCCYNVGGKSKNDKQILQGF